MIQFCEQTWVYYMYTVNSRVWAVCLNVLLIQSMGANVAAAAQQASLRELVSSNISESPDANLYGFVEFLKNREGWDLSVSVDSDSLSRAGLDLAMLPLQSHKCKNVERIAVIRSVLDAEKLGCYIAEDFRIVISTQAKANAAWRIESPPTIAELTAPDSLTRRAALFRSAYFPDNINGGIRELIEATKSDDTTSAFNAIFALGRMQDSKTIVPLLRDLLGNTDPVIAESAMWSLSRHGKAAARNILQHLSNIKEADGLNYAVKCLGTIDDDVSFGFQPLSDLIEHHFRAHTLRQLIDCELCGITARSMARISPEQCADWCLEHLSHDDPIEQVFASRVASNLHSFGGRCSNRLCELLASSELRVRRDVAFALSRIAPSGKFNLELLEQAANDSDQYVRIWSNETLRKLREHEESPQN